MRKQKVNLQAEAEPAGPPPIRPDERIHKALPRLLAADATIRPWERQLALEWFAVLRWAACKPRPRQNQPGAESKVGRNPFSYWLHAFNGPASRLVYLANTRRGGRGRKPWTQRSAELAERILRRHGALAVYRLKTGYARDGQGRMLMTPAGRPRAIFNYVRLVARDGGDRACLLQARRTVEQLQDLAGGPVRVENVFQLKRIQAARRAGNPKSLASEYLEQAHVLQVLRRGQRKADRQRQRAARPWDVQVELKALDFAGPGFWVSLDRSPPGQRLAACLAELRRRAPALHAEFARTAPPEHAARLGLLDQRPWPYPAGDNRLTPGIHTEAPWPALPPGGRFSAHPLRLDPARARMAPCAALKLRGR